MVSCNKHIQNCNWLCVLLYQGGYSTICFYIYLNKISFPYDLTPATKVLHSIGNYAWLGKVKSSDLITLQLTSSLVNSESSISSIT